MSKEIIKVNPHVRIEVAQIEFHEGQNTIWVHGPQGATILRIKCTGVIKVFRGCSNTCAHVDIGVQGDIDVCMPTTRKRSNKPAWEHSDFGKGASEP